MNSMIKRFVSRAKPSLEDAIRDATKKFRGGSTSHSWGSMIEWDDKRIDKTQFAFYLWEDLIRATKRYFDFPNRAASFFDYTMQILNSTGSNIALDFDEGTKEGDLVLVLPTKIGECLTQSYQDYAVGKVGIFKGNTTRDRVWEGTSFIVSRDTTNHEIHGDRYSLILIKARYIQTPSAKKDIDSLEEMIGHQQSPGPKIRKGDLVTVKSNTIIYEQEIAEDYEDIRGMFDRTGRKSLKPGKALSPHPTEEAYTTIPDIKTGQQYTVVRIGENSVYLLTDSGAIELPLRNVSKVKVPGDMAGSEAKKTEEDAKSDLEFAALVRKTVYEFYKRKGILQTCAKVRQAIRDYGIEAADILRKDNTIFYQDFLRCCEVLKYVRR